MFYGHPATTEIPGAGTYEYDREFADNDNPSYSIAFPLQHKPSNSLKLTTDYIINFNFVFYDEFFQTPILPLTSMMSSTPLSLLSVAPLPASWVKG